MAGYEKQDLRRAYVDTLIALAETEERLVVVDADLSRSILTYEFHERFPKRSFQVGVAEQDLVGTAVGLASSGLIPFASSYSIFLTGRSWEQIRNAADYGDQPVKLAGCHAGLSPSLDGPTHMGLEDYSALLNLPNTTVYAPCDANDLAALLPRVITESGPSYFRVHRNPLPVVVEVGKEPSVSEGGFLSFREGDDAVVVAVGTTLPAALEASDLLERQSISLQVIALSRLSPLDTASLGRLVEGRPLLVVEEHRTRLGFAAFLAKVLLESGCLPKPFASLGIDGDYPSSGPEEELREHLGLGSQGIANRILKLLPKN